MEQDRIAVVREGMAQMHGMLDRAVEQMSAE